MKYSNTYKKMIAFVIVFMFLTIISFITNEAVLTAISLTGMGTSFWLAAMLPDKEKYKQN